MFLGPPSDPSGAERMGRGTWPVSSFQLRAPCLWRCGREDRVRQGPTRKSGRFSLPRGPSREREVTVVHVCLGRGLINLSSSFRKQITEPGLVSSSFKVSTETRTGRRSVGGLHAFWVQSEVCSHLLGGARGTLFPNSVCRGVMLVMLIPGKSAKAAHRGFSAPRAGY